MRRSLHRGVLLAAILALAILETAPLWADDSPANAAVRQALEKPLTLNYEEEPLKQVVKDLQTKLGVPILLDSKAIIDAGLATDTPVTFSVANVEAKAAISLMLRSLILTTVVRDGRLLITTPEEAENLLEARVYDVADLVTTGVHGEGPCDFQPLVNAIKTCVGLVTWDEVGGPGSLVPFDTGGLTAIVVCQTDQVHESLEEFLAELHHARPEGREGPKSCIEHPPGPPTRRYRPPITARCRGGGGRAPGLGQAGLVRVR